MAFYAWRGRSRNEHRVAYQNSRVYQNLRVYKEQLRTSVKVPVKWFLQNRKELFWNEFLATKYKTTYNYIQKDNFIDSLVPQGGLVCEECPSVWMLFWVLDPLRVSKTSGTFLNKSDCELHEIMVKSRGHSMHTGHGIEPTVWRYGDFVRSQKVLFLPRLLVRHSRVKNPWWGRAQQDVNANVNSIVENHFHPL